MATLSRGRLPARRPLLRSAGLLLAAVLAVLLSGGLGFWQLDRARQKQSLQDRMQSRAEQPPLAQADLARSTAQAEAQHYRRIQLRGRWLADATVYLDNRQMNARPGFFVVTPLLLADGDAVLVQRGWMARNFIDRKQLAALPTATGEVVVDGRIAPPPSKLFQLGGAETGPIRQNLDVPGFAAEIRLPLRPLSVQQLASASASAGLAPAAAADSLLRQWPAPALDVGKHHGYAFQWFALAALITGLYVWFQLLRPGFARHHARSL